MKARRHQPCRSPSCLRPPSRRGRGVQHERHRRGRPGDRDAPDRHGHGQGRRDADGHARHLGRLRRPPSPTPWQRCSDTGTACANIDGARPTTTYVPTSADVGQTDRVVGTATNARRHDGSPSAVTAVIVSGAGPQNSAPPTVSGTPTEGQTLVGSRRHVGRRGADHVHVRVVALRRDRRGLRRDHRRDEQDLRARRRRRRQDAAARRDGQERARQRHADIGSDGRTIAAARPGQRRRAARRAPSRSTRRDVKLPAQLIIDKVSFSPNPLRSRAAFTAKIHISDSRGYVGAQRHRVRRGPALRPRVARRPRSRPAPTARRR